MNKKLGIFLIIAIILVGVIKFGIEFAPGSYPYTEDYTLDCSENQAIEAVKAFKIKHPEYTLSNDIGINDGSREKLDYWYHLYFYYPRENAIVYTWLRDNYEGGTTFALVAISPTMALSDLKKINRDFSSQENKDQKKKFEDRILHEIQDEIKIKK
jgi:hypothetical protein